jgi:hypothetical protein
VLENCIAWRFRVLCIIFSRDEDEICINTVYTHSSLSLLQCRSDNMAKLQNCDLVKTVCTGYMIFIAENRVKTRSNAPSRTKNTHTQSFFQAPNHPPTSVLLPLLDPRIRYRHTKHLLVFQIPYTPRDKLSLQDAHKIYRHTLYNASQSFPCEKGKVGRGGHEP